MKDLDVIGKVNLLIGSLLCSYAACVLCSVPACLLMMLVTPESYKNLSYTTLIVFLSAFYVSVLGCWVPLLFKALFQKKLLAYWLGAALVGVFVSFSVPIINEAIKSAG